MYQFPSLPAYQSTDRSKTMTNEEIINLNREYTFFTWAVQSKINPISATRSEGVYFWDADGKQYLDFSSQLMNVNAGHGNQKIIKAIQKQVAEMAYAYPAIATEPRGHLAQLLAEITPGDLCKTLFALGGAEANENGIKFARLYTGRNKIVTRYRSYHGATAGAMALSGDPRRLPVEPLIPGVVHVMDPYCYRCPFGWTLETCHRECIDHVEQVVKFEGPENVAALMLEGVTGTSGLIIPPDDYWPRMRELCDKYDILLIDDEVMSGFGRTGEWFGINHWDVVPDIMTLAKGITAGYVPLGAVIVSRAIADYFADRPLPMGLTYSGHPVCTAAGIATIEVYQEERLVENAKVMGAILNDGLEELKIKHPSVGDVRCIGLFSVIELVKDKETKEPLAPWNARPHEMGIMAQVPGALRERGMYTFSKWNWIFVVPPLNINETELRDGLRILDEVLDITDRGCSTQ
ncbi:MAG: aminotransferase class III-fold pyridoxal phosphate-dependent enzyme [Chloroflexota bacterium]|nr:aminotransferase class III-fold pyridoxal phosphate-dependent enzyme [Chloroflexota bacterium]